VCSSDQVKLAIVYVIEKLKKIWFQKQKRAPHVQNERAKQPLQKKLLVFKTEREEKTLISFHSLIFNALLTYQRMSIYFYT